MASLRSEGEDKLTACLKHAATSILSVGSGDGSQQLAIVREGHTNLCATFYDSKSELLRKYPHAGSILEELEAKCKYPPVFKVDATKLQDYKQTVGSSFGLIFFTFPHTGVSNNLPESVQSNRDLLRGFLSSAHHLLAPDGQVQLTLKSGQYYARWNLKSVVNEMTGLQYDGCAELRKEQFPGYSHRLTNGMNGQLKTVSDKSGATVHRFRQSSAPSGAQGRTSHLTCIDIIAMHTPDDEDEDDSRKRKASRDPLTESGSRTDDWIQQRVLSYLGSSAAASLTVLEIRRGAFTNPLPTVAQINRVLYRMKDVSILQQLPCQGSSKKPRWNLMDDADRRTDGANLLTPNDDNIAH